MKPLPDPRLRLIAITDRHLCGGTEGLLSKCADLLRAGLPGLMLREKDLSGAELYRLAKELRAQTDRHNALLLVNDRPDVALAAGAAGVHLGGSAIPPAAVRQLAPSSFLIGASCHSPEELKAAHREGANYAFLSPVFAPQSKRTDSPALGAAKFLELAEEAPLPVVALGGTTPTRALELFDGGAAGIAAIGAFFQGDNAGQNVREFERAFNGKERRTP